MRVGMVHRRLAILDLDPRANQPFADEAGRVIVFNGEIYNFRAVRESLPDQKWRTECDTEALLAAYATWGEGCLDRLNGMFAFAVWDPREGRLFLARDRMGQKPLYYAAGPEAVAFASEPAALLEVPWVDVSVDAQGVADYLMWGHTPRGSIYRGIGKVAPGRWMSVEAGGMREKRYFVVQGSGRQGSESRQDACTTTATTRRLVTQAVRRQLIADVPLGCFLSGGTDSSIIAAAMRAAVPRDQPVLTFCIGFDDPAYDETAYAAAVARHLGTEHRTFVVRPDAAADLPKLAATFAEPFGDSSALPTHYLARETRGFVKVALSGDGGDELFGGYDRYRAVAIAQRLARWPLLMKALACVVGAVPAANPKSRVARLQRLLATAHLAPGPRYASYLELFDLTMVARLMAPMGGDCLGMKSERLLTERYEDALGFGLDPVQAAMAVDRELYLPEDLLTKVDRCSMMYALEVRSPFMDHELVQFAAGLSTAELIGRGPKRVLRDAFAGDLPAGVFERRKMGFAVPIGEWFRTSLREMVHDLLFAGDSFMAGNLDVGVVKRVVDEHEGRRADHTQRIYALLMLELWWRGRRKGEMRKEE